MSEITDPNSKARTTCSYRPRNPNNLSINDPEFLLRLEILDFMRTPNICLTCEDIAQATGVSRKTIHYIEKRAIAKLTKALRKKLEYERIELATA